MDSNQLFQFRSIAECGSITKAAQKLYITQPALSIALNKLETDLGCRLFNRDTKRLTLTKEGSKLLEYAIVVTDAIRQAEEYFALQDRKNTVRCFRIGGINYPIISKGCHSIDGYSFSGVLLSKADLQREAGSSEADVILADERHIMDTPTGFKKELLYRQSLLLVCPKEHELTEFDEVPIHKLQKYPVAGHANPYGFASWVKEVKRVNHCNIWEDANLNFTSWLTEGESLPLPYLMNSFGISTVWNMISDRKIIPVIGEYTQRDIIMWYRTKEEERLLPIIDRIRDNVKDMLEADKSYHELIFGNTK